MLKAPVVDRFLRGTAVFGVFVAKLNIAGGVAWLLLSEFDRSAVSFATGLILWPFAAWARDAVDEASRRDGEQ
ncbi:hypothetical protein ACPF7Z_08800 [Halomonas sp. GXIMD04776]|uniref:hypothetical protein n=1 Tax=Halomonas sp. GXIMD04776 TaxID=3415605 RepID=UPI003C818395